MQHNIQQNQEIELDEKDENYSDDDLYKIKSWGADLSFRELIQMYKENELIKPELQRKYVWEKKEASRFIESVLLGLPIPSIFLAVDKQTQNRIIIDGYQRIMTIYDYVERGVWTEETDKEFKLSRQGINSKWAGLAFTELSTVDQKKIRNTTIHTIIFEQVYPNEEDTSLYQIFERINTGGRTLTPQEIRNCVSQGPLNSLLFELNENPSWRALWNAPVDTRMKDMEYILRFFTLYDFIQKDIKTEQILMKKELNLYMQQKHNQTEEKIVLLKEIFTKTMVVIQEFFGNQAFYKTTKFHATIFDAIAIATALSYKELTTTNINFMHKKEVLLNDTDFIRFTTQRTTRTEHIIGRIRKAKEILYNA